MAIKPESIKTKLPVLFQDGVPLHKCKFIQDGKGVFYGKTRSSGFLAFLIQGFDKNKAPSGYTRFTKGSHAFSSRTKGYTFPNEVTGSDLQLATDRRSPAGAKLTCNQTIVSTRLRRDLKEKSYIAFKAGSFEFYDVHSLGYPPVGTKVESGHIISETYNWSQSHGHNYVSKDGKQYDMATLIIEAGKQYDKALEEALKPPVDPCVEKLDSLKKEYEVKLKKVEEELSKCIKTIQTLTSSLTGSQEKVKLQGATIQNYQDLHEKAVLELRILRGEKSRVGVMLNSLVRKTKEVAIKVFNKLLEIVSGRK